MRYRNFFWANEETKAPIDKQQCQETDTMLENEMHKSDLSISGQDPLDFMIERIRRLPER
jgi:hypothetical protein